jgi:penicillin amidase
LTVAVSADANGVPGIWAADPGGAYYALGWLHGRHRGVQSLLAAAAGRGVLARQVWPRKDLLDIDTVVHRFDLEGRAQAAARRLDADSSALLHSYCRGLRVGVHGGPARWLERWLAPPDPEALLATLALSAYLGLAQCQERMEWALVQALHEGADPGMLEQLFGPSLQGWEPDRLCSAPLPPMGRAAGGSNAWAVTGARSASGRPILCGDPHLQVDQLPAVFFEVRARVGDNYWLGATIPGLPGLAVGRSRYVAWSGTFSVADNIDCFIDPESGEEETVHIGRRFLPPLPYKRQILPHGVRQGRMRVQWAGLGKLDEAMRAYLNLPEARSLDEAERILRGAHTLSLHYVLADKEGVRHVQAGRVPRRSRAWSGLYPVVGDRAVWTGFLEGAELPRRAAEDGVLVSANEGGVAKGELRLSTLAAPEYRKRRIEYLLRASRAHDIESMQRIQLDVLSARAVRLAPWLCPALRWDHRFDPGCTQATAFSLALRAARGALAPWLGHRWFVRMLDASELPVWWGDALDTLMDQHGFWASPAGVAARDRVAALRADARPWGEAQRLRLRHLWLPGGGRGPFPLAGDNACVRQGMLGPAGAVGPAYRFIADLADDAIYSTLPGGIDEWPNRPSYDCFLQEWLAGGLHRIAAPDAAETREVLVA